jgi:hypothetical protein
VRCTTFFRAGRIGRLATRARPRSAARAHLGERELPSRPLRTLERDTALDRGAAPPPLGGLDPPHHLPRVQHFGWAIPCPDGRTARAEAHESPEKNRNEKPVEDPCRRASALGANRVPSTAGWSTPRTASAPPPHPRPPSPSPSQGDPRAAELLVLELEEPSADLAERVKKARRARDEKQRQLASMARDLDPAIGRRARMRVSAAFGVLWTAIPWLGWFIEGGDPSADQRAPLFSSTLMFILAIAIAIAVPLDASLSRTALNRSLVRAVGVVLVAPIAVYAVTLTLGVSYEHTRVLVLLLYAACCALTAAGVERKLWPSASAYAAITAIACVWPWLAWPVESFANLVLTINILVIWRGEAADSQRPEQSTE